MFELALVFSADPKVPEFLKTSLASADHYVLSALSAGEVDLVLEYVLPDVLILDESVPVDLQLSLLSKLREDGGMRRVATVALCNPDGCDGLRGAIGVCVQKPLTPKRVATLVKAMLRGKALNLDVVEYSGLRLDSSRLELSGPLGRASLRPVEFKFLFFLMTHTARAFSRHQLLEAVWGGDESFDRRLVDVYIAQLRRALKSCAGDRAYIQTVRSVGYVFS